MANIRLIPSTYTSSHSSYASVYSGEANMYNNTDHTANYASLRGRNSNTTTAYYIFLRGFNFDDVPANASVTSFEVKIRCYRNSYQRTGANYRLRLSSSTSINDVIDDSITSTEIGTSASVITIPTGNLTWNTLKNYGDDFSIVIPLSSTASNRPYIYVYGAEINVTYSTLPTYEVTATSNVTGVEVSPATQTIVQGDSATIYIETSDISDYVLKDNGTDVTSSVEYHYEEGGSTTEDTVLGDYTLVSGSFNGSGTSHFSGLVGKGHTASTTTSNYYSGGSGVIAVFTYDVSFHNIPENATIENCYALVNGHAESTSQSSEYMCAQIRSGDTELSDELNFKSVGTSNSTQTITCTTIPTIAQLENLQLYCRLGYYGGALNGATVYVEYSTPTGYYYTYTITNVVAAHTVVLAESTGPYIPDPEDPTKTYYSLTISSINAATSIGSELVNGTIRIEEGSNETIVISPTDPQLTLALDNGVDISSQLVGGTPVNTYTVTTQVSGASYGFTLNTSTGYYVSTNNGVSKSASVARLNMDFESDCLVTIQYINYAEADYDYGMFGKLDTSVATDGLTAGSGGSSPSDSTSNYQLAKCSNSTSPQTISYTVPAGQHFIDIKYGKDDASDSGNDNLQWKVLSVEATSAGGEYTYTLTNINQKHSLIFIFGNVSYYFVTSVLGGAGRAFPDGQQVVLEGDNYKLNIVPDNYQATVTLTDNGVNVTSQMEVATGQDKQGNTITSYKYELSNVQAAHTLSISIGGVETKLYIKINGSWVQYSKVYTKVNGAWVEQSDPSAILSTTVNYVKAN